MTDLESLITNYAVQVTHPWATNLAPPQRCWMVVYGPAEERRLRARLQAFENATISAGKGWELVDITDAPGAWIAQNPYRERYFEKPQLLNAGAIQDFRRYIVAHIQQAASKAGDADSVVGVLGVGSLFGFAETSWLLNEIAPLIAGRLVVFFPGEYRRNNYRLLGAREGWNYLALAITA